METSSEDVFDQIAPAWYNFRHWSIFAHELEVLAKRWQQGKLLNLGCGHGPDFLAFKKGFKLYGVDSSAEMLKLARKYSRKFKFTAELVLADASNLPYPDDSFDWAISVATYHHIRYPEARQRAFNELERVLKPGGEAFITVWNRWQPRFWFKPKEVSVPWRQADKTLYRYYYLFSYAELEKLARQAGLKVLRSFPESSHRSRPKLFSRNICLLLSKATS
jgi:ubiquinone/menaquinone biosynthesis C-methylase UbiE